MEEEGAVNEDTSNDDFDAAFAEAASESPNAEQDINTDEGPGEVGTDNGDGDFDQSFTDAAVNAAASRGDVADVDLAAKLAEMEKETERLKQSERSQRGRVAALSKKLVELDRAKKELPAEATVTDDEQQGNSKNWEDFKAEFPEMAAIVDERLAPVDNRINSVAKTIEAVTATQDTIIEKEILAYKEAQFDILAEKHADFDQIKSSKEFADFRATADADIQAKIKSKHADDAIEVLDAFKAQTGWKAQVKDTGKSEVEKINERRAAALKKSVGVSSKNVGHSAKVDAGSEDDFDNAFAARAAKIENKRSIHY